MKKTRTRVKKHSGSDKIHAFRESLLEWYDQNRRDLPWRYAPGEAADPYAVWLSEIMLQQTTVAAVIPYFLKFVSKWPDVFALAAADINEVMKEWAGLGYYARARNLHKCAQVVAFERGGVFPEDQKDLMTLPGIGEYTSAAIRAIAFGKSATVVDGNVERVMARVHGLQGDRQEVKKQAKDHARAYFEGYEERPGDLAQAFMDLGAGVCIPKIPRCVACPLEKHCSSAHTLLSAGRAELSKVSIRPAKKGYVYWVDCGRGNILAHRRSPGGLLGGMLCLPTTGWVGLEQDLKHLPFILITEGAPPHGEIRHSFTHFELSLLIFQAKVDMAHNLPEGYTEVPVTSFESAGFPSVFRKVGAYISSF